MNEVNIVAQQSGCRLDKYLSETLPDFSRSLLKNLIESGSVTVNAQTKKGKYTVKIGDIINVCLPEPEPSEAIAEDIQINIVYQDDDIVVVDKVQGMVVHPAAGNYTGTLVNALLFHVKDLSGIGGVMRPGIVHRIDKDTSGLLVVAKNDAAHKSLSEQIAQKTARREYTALLKGRVAREGRVVLPIARSKKDRKKMCVDMAGKYAATDYDIIKLYDTYTLAHLKLETGRTHQIRVHMAHLGHGVVGDPVYGGASKIKTKGQLLHACKLEFEHPTSGKTMTFESPLPEYFSNILAKLRESD